MRAVHTVDNPLHLTHRATLVRVQNMSNLIAWKYTQGDATSVDIIVSNGDNTTLNGNFSIARNVPVSQEVCLALCSLPHALIQSCRPSP